MKTKHSKALKPELRQTVECLRQFRGAFKELSLRSGKTKSFVSKWASGIRNSSILTELAISLCKEARETGGVRVFVEQSSARAAVTRLRGLKDQ